MASKRKVSLPSYVDYASGDGKRWYIDFYTTEGQLMHRCKLFVTGIHGDESWEDLGQVKSISISCVDLHPEIECLDVEVTGNTAYQLAPQLYSKENMVKDKEDTMFSRGFKIDLQENSEITTSGLLDDISVALAKRSKKFQKVGTPTKKTKASQGTSSSQRAINLSDIDMVDPSSTGIDIIDPKILANKKGKAKEETIGSIDQYKEYFQFGVFTEVDIPVVNCKEAPKHYTCRTLDKPQVMERLKGYIEHKNRPSSCAYLMPVKFIKEGQAIPLTKEQVRESKLQEYFYWIIDGQHSIYAAKVVMLHILPAENMDLKDIYRYRKARIIVNAPAEVCVAISRLANLEAQALFKKQPYGDILKHLRAQWVHYNMPSRPQSGLLKGHSSRVDWDKFICSAERSMGEYFAQKQAHMVTCADDIFQGWMDIIKGIQEGTLSGKAPNQTQFRCLAGLDEAEVRMLQAELQTGVIVLSSVAVNEKNLDAAKEKKMDLTSRVMQLKKEKVAQQDLSHELLKEFNKANSSHKCQSWNELKQFYNVSDKVFSVFLRMCDTWIKAKLQVGKAAPEFTSEIKSYIEWIIAQHSVNQYTYDYPWKVLAVSIGFERSLFMARHIVHPIPIGLCVLDTTEGAASMMLWTEERISDFLRGIMDVTGGTGHQQFVSLSFLKLSELVHLHAALKKLGGWSKIFYGSIEFVGNAPCNGATQLFAVLVYLSSTEVFEGFNDFVSIGGPTLDATLLEIDFNKVKDLSPRDFLRHKKVMVITKCIQSYCLGDLMVIDAFSDGFVSKHALKERRDVYCLVDTVEEVETLQSELLQYAKSDDEIREWARIPCEDLQLVQVVEPINTFLEESHFSPPKENSTNEILDLNNLFTATSSLLDLERGTGAK